MKIMVRWWPINGYHFLRSLIYSKWFLSGRTLWWKPVFSHHFCMLLRRKRPWTLWKYLYFRIWSILKDFPWNIWRKYSMYIFRRICPWRNNINRQLIHTFDFSFIWYCEYNTGAPLNFNSNFFRAYHRVVWKRQIWS